MPFASTLFSKTTMAWLLEHWPEIKDLTADELGQYVQTHNREVEGER